MSIIITFGMRGPLVSSVQGPENGSSIHVFSTGPGIFHMKLYASHIVKDIIIIVEITT